MVGALTLSRVVNDPDLAKAFLDAAAQQVREAVAARKDGPIEDVAAPHSLIK